MKEHDDLKWFLIRKFIVTLIAVGVTEYALTVGLNVFIMPKLLGYFFPDYNAAKVTGLESIAFLLVMVLMLTLGAIGTMLPYATNGIAKAALEWLQSSLSNVMKSVNETTSIYNLTKVKAFVLFATMLVLIVVIVVPYVVGALYFAKIVIEEIGHLQKKWEEQRMDFDKKRNLMLSDIAHDLRTPMTTVNGYAKALAEGMVTDEEKRQEYLAAIQNKSVRMNELINLLFEYVKLDSEGFVLNMESVDICELLRENAALMYSDIEDAGMNIDVNIPEEPCFVMCDRVQISRVAGNLLTNAVRHNPSGTTITLALYVRKNINDENSSESVINNNYMSNDGITIAVADNGEEIAPETAKNIFEPFAKGDASRNSPGSGLGLSIAKKVVQMHGWELTLVQKPSEQITKAFVVDIH